MFEDSIFYMMHIKKDHRRVLENFFSLSILNVANYVFPIILIPYLTRVLGVEKYGTYIYAYSIINYLTLLYNMVLNILLLRKSH